MEQMDVDVNNTTSSFEQLIEFAKQVDNTRTWEVLTTHFQYYPQFDLLDVQTVIGMAILSWHGKPLWVALAKRQEFKMLPATRLLELAHISNCTDVWECVVLHPDFLTLPIVACANAVRKTQFTWFYKKIANGHPKFKKYTVRLMFKFAQVNDHFSVWMEVALHKDFDSLPIDMAIIVADKVKDTYLEEPTLKRVQTRQKLQNDFLNLFN